MLVWLFGVQLHLTISETVLSFFVRREARHRYVLLLAVYHWRTLRFGEHNWIARPTLFQVGLQLFLPRPNPWRVVLHRDFDARLA